MEHSNKINEIQKKINLYLDKALNEEDQMNMMKELNSDPSFPQMVNKERNFRTLLKNKVERSTVSSDLIQSIINQVKLD